MYTLICYPRIHCWHLSTPNLICHVQSLRSQDPSAVLTVDLLILISLKNFVSQADFVTSFSPFPSSLVGHTPPRKTLLSHDNTVIGENGPKLFENPGTLYELDPSNTDTHSSLQQICNRFVRRDFSRNSFTPPHIIFTRVCT